MLAGKEKIIHTSRKFLAVGLLGVLEVKELITFVF